MNDAGSLNRPSSPPQYEPGQPVTRAEALRKVRWARAAAYVHFISTWEEGFATASTMLRARADLRDLIATLEAEAGVTLGGLDLARHLGGADHVEEREQLHPDFTTFAIADRSGWVLACREHRNPPKVNWTAHDDAALLRTIWARRALVLRTALTPLDALLRAAAAGVELQAWLDGIEGDFSRWECQSAALALLDDVEAYLARPAASSDRVAMLH